MRPRSPRSADENELTSQMLIRISESRYFGFLCL